MKLTRLIPMVFVALLSVGAPIQAPMLVPMQAMAAVAVDEDALQDPLLEAKARDIMKDIRCLVCQNQSIEDSGADLAQDLRRIVRERVVAGDDADAVKTYLVDRYGDWVLLRPPFKARTAVLWIAPAIFLVIGLGGLVVFVRRRNAIAEGAAAAAPLSADDEARLKKLEEDLG